MLPFSAGALSTPGGQGMLSKHFLTSNFTAAAASSFLRSVSYGVFKKYAPPSARSDSFRAFYLYTPMYNIV